MLSSVRCADARGAGNFACESLRAVVKSPSTKATGADRGDQTPHGKGYSQLALTVRAQAPLGLQLKALRESRTHLSARALSLNAGLSESYVGKVEAGNCEPSLRAFSKIVVELGLKPQEAWVLIMQEAHRT